MTNPRGFQYPPDSSNLSNRQISVIDIDLSVNRSGAVASPGIDLKIKGDWFAVDPGSVGAMRAAFTLKDTRDVQSVLMAPGRVFNTPFVDVRVFNDIVANEQTGVAATASAPIALRCLYGVGTTPTFLDRSIHDGGRLLLFSASATSGVSATNDYPVTEGCLIETWLRATQVVGVAEIARLRASIDLRSGGNTVATIHPDTQVYNDVFPAGVAQSTFLSAVFRNIVIPRGIDTMRVIARNETGAIAASVSLNPTVELR